MAGGVKRIRQLAKKWRKYVLKVFEGGLHQLNVLFSLPTITNQMYVQ